MQWRCPKVQLALLLLILLGSVITQTSAESAKTNASEQVEVKQPVQKIENSKAPARLNQLAPDFDLPAESGEMVRLSDFRGKKRVVVYFYPKDETPNCTKEACTFRDSYEELKDLGADVIGISSDSVGSHKSFAEKHKLPFLLLSDPEGKVRAQWGVPASFAILPGRVTYVIDKKGIIRRIFNSQLDGAKHVAEAKKALALLKAED